ncbi:GNAT family N-acetyltransferase [Oricola sp.]|uniref:GNAT family N-acetyltransferase n=1 Tax=Oricola sp. TaxID=1979950 RepID=UPI0025DC19AC|nr:GNAT family N-acetyltransferase [Oricola sp.]MCI5078411.1 GNAT family N-acetyltransferase [Oricola sp.]
MADHVLDRPIWAALSTGQSGLAVGGPNALRFPADISPLSALRDDSEDSLRDLAALVGPGETVILARDRPSPVPPGLVEDSRGDLTQMIATHLVTAEATDDILPLGDADAPEMLELATMTKPGPFLARTHTLGDFIGMRKGGRLVAMAGERMHPAGYCEVSGVCTHPDCRGHGYAGLLTRIVATRILERGETPFLHAYAANETAIRLYEKLGFSRRRVLTLQALRRP